ncbi:MAG: uracil-DNA glycosylase, partial [Planctomycetes bacterium]|nr:uracil-DNA glycosylase [Planctomycetota bacterium]
SRDAPRRDAPTRDASTSGAPHSAVARPSATPLAAAPASSTLAPRPPPPRTFGLGTPASPDAPARSRDDVVRIAAACGDFASLRAAVARCEACPLSKTRTQTVFADGPERADVLFIGEAPGESEDLLGVPFVGESGKMLTGIIEKGMGLPRAQVLIVDALKCRPPHDRAPSVEETRACTPWLDRQVALAAPKVLIPLGTLASNHVLGLAGSEQRSLGSLRERVHEREARSIVPTFHPSYLLRTPEAKKDCWKDIQLAMGLLGLAPKRGG